ncbi:MULTISPECIES: Ig-like domain-containing protein [Pseudomonas]|uniref:Ig-like domain-containing protein n=1 Tax=Pseudomonas TaxID=286 RepID=UPI001F1A0100|nr:Ig-like domain-containing protein [Pseudomonas sputi]
MINQSVRANQSLVSNGDFSKVLTGWTILPANSPWVRVVGLNMNGFPIKAVTIGNSASIRQRVTAPVSTGPDATYVVKFLAESRHPATGRVHIHKEDELLLEIEIPPGPSRTGADPQSFDPVEYVVPLEAAFTGPSDLTITFISASSGPADYDHLLYFTRIEIQLQLAPLALQALLLDEQTYTPSQPLYVCLGAEHQVGFDIVPGNIWLGTQASLTIEDNPQGAIVAQPDWHIDHPLDQRWKLSCPVLDLSAPHPLTITVWNRYNASPCKIGASLGHHRLDFLDVKAPSCFPVLDESESVQAGVQVGSFYTSQTLEGLTVTWAVDGHVTGTSTVTDANGWSYFDFIPVAAGTFILTASVASLYYAEGVVTQAFSVTVLATSPWPDVLAVVADQATPWEQKTGWPNRGATYPLLVRFSEVFVGTEVKLHWEGDSPGQLGVEVSPALDLPLPVPAARALLWELRSADVLDGTFRLRLSCSKLLKSSPEKTMKLARNEVVLGDVREADRTCIVENRDGAWIWLQVLHHVASGTGEAVRGALVDVEYPVGTRTHTITGNGGWASFRCQPDSAGDHLVTARIKAHPDAVPIERAFYVKAIASSPWNTQARILLDGEEVDRQSLGVICCRGEPHTLKVLPAAGSTWIGKTVSAHWRNADPQIGLTLGDVGVPKTLTTAGVEWPLSSQASSSRSSPFELELRVAGEPIVLELPGRLMSPDLPQELSLLLDQVLAPLDGQGLYPCQGALHTLNVVPEALSPLVGLHVSLTWSGTPGEQLGATLQPPSGQSQVLNAGGAIWTLDCTDSRMPGQFALTVALPQLDTVAPETTMMLDNNRLTLQSLRAPAIDPVVGLDKAWIRARLVSYYTGQPVPDVPVTWEAEGRFTEVKTDVDGRSAFGFDPKTEGDHQVSAQVVSRYDGYRASYSTTAKALGSDPWETLRVSFDGSVPHLAGSKTYFPRRKGNHELLIMAADDSPLFGQTLRLGLSGTGPGDLGLTFQPTNVLGLPQRFAGELRYSFSVGDLKDGSCILRLGAERLARLSPAMPMSVGAGEQVSTISVVSRADPILYWGEPFIGQVKVLSSVSGKAMAGVEVNWLVENDQTVTGVTDYYGNARLRFVPTITGTSAVKASVGSEALSRSVSLPYQLLEPRSIASLTSPVTSGPVGTRVSAEVQVVSALTGLPQHDVDVHWGFRDLVLQPSKTDVEGKATVSFRLPNMNRSLLEAYVTGGCAGWEVEYLEFRVIPNV